MWRTSAGRSTRAAAGLARLAALESQLRPYSHSTPTPTPNNKTLDYYKFHTDMSTRWKDNDQYSHINNAVYYSLFDSAVNIYLLSHIHSSASTSKPVFYVASSRAAYHASASFPDLLRVGVAVGKLGRSSVTYHLGVFRQLAEKEDWQCCVTGEFVHVLVDDAGKSVEIPSEIRQKLELLVPKPTA